MRRAKDAKAFWPDRVAWKRAKNENSSELCVRALSSRLTDLPCTRGAVSMPQKPYPESVFPTCANNRFNAKDIGMQHDTYVAVNRDKH